VNTKLLIAHGAVLTDSAAGVMVTDDPVADLDARRGAGGQLFNDATWLVAGDHVRGFRAPVTVKIGAAQARSPYLEHCLARPGVGVWKLSNLCLPVSRKCHSAHVISP
jgi:hypothetical protein